MSFLPESTVNDLFKQKIASFKWRLCFCDAIMPTPMILLLCFLRCLITSVADSPPFASLSPPSDLANVTTIFSVPSPSLYPPPDVPPPSPSNPIITSLSPPSPPPLTTYSLMQGAQGPPATNWWSLPMQQLCASNQQCGSGFYCPYSNFSPSAFSKCRPCAVACMVCASALLEVSALDAQSCSWCQCSYIPAVGPSELSRRLHGITAWAPCNKTTACMVPTLTQHEPSKRANTTSPSLPFEALYPTRLFCSLASPLDGKAPQPSSLSSGRGYCRSCLTDCESDVVSAEGSCMQSCGLPPLASLPALGLPLNLRDPSLTLSSSSGLPEGHWPVLALIDAQSLFASALPAARPSWGGASSEGNGLGAADFPSPVQLGNASVNSTQFRRLLARSGLAEGRLPEEMDSAFDNMDTDPTDRVITPLE